MIVLVLGFNQLLLFVRYDQNMSDIVRIDGRVHIPNLTKTKRTICNTYQKSMSWLLKIGKIKRKTTKKTHDGARLYAPFLCVLMAEKVGFEPTWRLHAKRISSAPRYDHFGTSPLPQ